MVVFKLNGNLGCYNPDDELYKVLSKTDGERLYLPNNTTMVNKLKELNLTFQTTEDKTSIYIGKDNILFGVLTNRLKHKHIRNNLFLVEFTRTNKLYIKLLT